MATHKYLEILSELRDRCSDAPEGTRLAGERTLASEFGVSTMTVRQSLSRLVDEGWIRRRRGSGTYVSRPRRRVAMGPTLTSFTEDMKLMGLAPSARVMRFEEVRPDWETATRLRLADGEKALLLERLRLADGEPMSHEIAYFPSTLKYALPLNDLDSSVHASMIDHGVVPYSTFRAVRAVPVPSDECELLNIPSGSPGLEIVDVFADASSRPVESVQSRYRYDRYEVVNRLHRQSPATDGGAAT